MKIRNLILIGVLCAVAAGCTSSQPAASSSSLQPEYRSTATIKDIMDLIVDPNADELWGSVAFSVDATGTHDKFPRTDEEWKAVRRNVVTLMEATNLLMIPGRIVAKPHEKSENPGIELEPEEIQKLIDGDKRTFFDRAHGLHDAVMLALKAVDSKDKDMLLESGDEIDQACEKCHLKYWYPNEAQTQEQQRQVIPPPTGTKK